MTYSSPPEERRITLRLLAYWEKKRGSRSMPVEGDMDPADIADLWQNCFLVHVHKIGVPGYHFTYLGKAIEDIYREGLSESEPSVDPLDMEIFGEGYRQVIDKGTPLVQEGEMTNPHGDMFKYRQVLLPLGSGGKVAAVFGGMRFLRIVSYK